MLLKPVMWFPAFLGALVVFVSSAHATDIGGTISSTLTIAQDSQLVDDVTCTVTGAPCIAIGAPNVKLALNGFTMTGQADPQTGCGGNAIANEIGIEINAQSSRGSAQTGLWVTDGMTFYLQDVSGGKSLTAENTLATVVVRLQRR